MYVPSQGMSTPTTAPTAAPTSTSPQNATTPPTIATDSTTTDAVTTSTTPTPTASPAEDNCIGLHESFQLSWTLLPETEEARFTLCGCQSLIPGLGCLCMRASYNCVCSLVICKCFPFVIRLVALACLIIAFQELYMIIMATGSVFVNM